MKRVRFIDRAGQPYVGEIIPCSKCGLECINYETLDMRNKVRGDEKAMPRKAYLISAGIYQGMHICPQCTGDWGKAEVKNQ
jgi:hypothetical protein